MQFSRIIVYKLHEDFPQSHKSLNPGKQFPVPLNQKWMKPKKLRAGRTDGRRRNYASLRGRGYVINETQLCVSTSVPAGVKKGRNYASCNALLSAHHRTRRFRSVPVYTPGMLQTAFQFLVRSILCRWINELQGVLLHPVVRSLVKLTDSPVGPCTHIRS
jgi:hypothetical protein